MKMVKSLLLGSAAGLVAVTGAQAADLPVKAKPVEYVKVCTLYGAGFYYIPGTDTCIKIGGFVRAEWNHNASGSFATNVSGQEGLYARSGNTLLTRSRVGISWDVRSQTEYGTLRAYAQGGWQYSTNDAPTTSLPATNGSNSPAVSGGLYFLRAFIQFAGFTFGKTASYYDFFNTGAYSYQTALLFRDTAGVGLNIAAYTAQFGNGLSATISLEDQSNFRRTLVDLSGPVFTSGVPASNQSSDAGNTIPDIVGNIRVDQAWGSAQISGAAHLNRVWRYGFTNVGVPSLSNTEHPGDKWGWAGSAGITLKMPWDAKDTLSAVVQYCKGASGYCSNFSAIRSDLVFGLVNENLIGVAWASDAFFATDTRSGLELAKMWNVTAAFEHYWTPTLRSSIYGVYNKWESGSSLLEADCLLNGFTTANCADWSAYQVGTRTIWNPVPNLDIGLEVMYTKVNSAFADLPGGNIGSVTPTNGVVAGNGQPVTVGDTHVWSGIFRVQRNFWP